MAIIFDFDGTIVDTLGSTHDFLKHCSSMFKWNYPCTSKEELKENWFEPFDEFYLKYGFDFKSNKDLAMKEWEAFILKKHSPEIPGMIDVMRKLSGRFKLGIASSNRKKFIEQKIDDFAIGSFISSYACGDDIKKFKPDPEVIKLCMQRMNAVPEETIYVGDLPSDVIAAKRAGCKSIAVTWGFGMRDKLEKASPDFIVDSPDEILYAIEEQSVFNGKRV